jgi:TonB family protein
MIYKKYSWLSFIAHLVLLVGFSLKLTVESANKEPFLVSYLFFSPEHSHEPAKENLIIHKPEQHVRGSRKQVRLSASHHFQRNTVQMVSVKQEKQEQQAQKTLLTLLHNAIAAKQNYPESALDLKQTGTVVIQFLLAPTGELTHISLLKSSGFTSIDQAALMAVRAASPIKKAGIYLQAEKYFSLEVIFKQHD